MIVSTLRKGALIVAVPALLAGAAASPAMASDKYDDHSHDNYYSSIEVKVCKVVKHDKGNRGHQDKKSFKIHVKTDYDYAAVWVREGKCEKVYLDYKDAKFKVTEDYAHGYEFVYMKCSDGAYDAGYNQCKFDKYDDQVKVTVHNKEKGYSHSY